MDLQPPHLGLPEKFTKFFPWQLPVAMEIVNAFKSHRFVFLQAPPGIGKSVINFIVSLLLDARLCYLVPTKALARQVMSEFGSMLTEVHGHSNYPCASIIPEHEYFDCRDGRNCQYRQDIANLRDTRSNVLTNYAHHLTLGANQMLGDNGLGTFDLLICDEGHTLKNWLSDFTAIKLKPILLGLLGITQYPKSKIIYQWQEWALENYLALNRSEFDPEQKKLVDRVKLTLWRVANHVTDNWICVDRPDHYLLHPVWARGFNENAFQGIANVLLTSATIFHSEHIPLGIKRDDVKFIEIPSQFPPERRPFIYCPAEFVDYRMTTTTWGNLVRKVDGLIEARSDVKGIVQTKSFDRADDYYFASRLKPQIILDQRGPIHQRLKLFKSSPAPSTFVSPRIEEGHDFAGDLARYNIITKLPRLDKRDPVTAARIKEFSGYQDNETLQSLIQGYGRVDRNMKDWGETIIVDKHFEGFLKRRTLPKYIMDAYKHITSSVEVKPLKEVLSERGVL